MRSGLRDLDASLSVIRIKVCSQTLWRNKLRIVGLLRALERGTRGRQAAMEAAWCATCSSKDFQLETLATTESRAGTLDWNSTA